MKNSQKEKLLKKILYVCKKIKGELFPFGKILVLAVKKIKSQRFLFVIVIIVLLIIFAMLAPQSLGILKFCIIVGTSTFIALIAILVNPIIGMIINIFYIIIIMFFPEKQKKRRRIKGRKGQNLYIDK